jgi:uncharacterized repeat protein (TIGR03943 family)
VNRQAQAFLMFLVGGAVLRAGLTDLYLRYVKAGLRPLLLIAGAVLIVAAIATVWYEFRQARAARDRAGHKHRGNDDKHHEPRIAWLLVLPLFALILVTPPPLGSYTAARSGTVVQPPPAGGFPALPADDPVRLRLTSYAARAVYDHGHSLGERRITVTGFVTFDRRGVPYLTRMVLTCCAADGQPVKVGLTGQVPAVLQTGGWLEVIGTYADRQTKDAVNGAPIPFINVSDTRPVPAPPDPYEN